jgi:hypothetical protein
MAGLLHDLLGIVKVAVISGGDWPQSEKQLLSNLPMMKAWESIPPSDLWNKVLPIFGRLEKALFRRFHRGGKRENHRFSKEGSRRCRLQGRKGLGRSH